MVRWRTAQLHDLRHLPARGWQQLPERERKRVLDVGKGMSINVSAGTVRSVMSSTAPPHRGLGRRLLDVVGTVISVVVAVVGALALVLAVATHFAPAGSFTVAGHPMLGVLSGSMSPVIGTGDMIIDEKLSADHAAHLQVGQIISFYPADGGSTPITHRIHAVTSLGGAVTYVTKGDANNAPDGSTVAPSRIVGVYDAKIPAAGYVMNALHQPLTLGLLLAAPLLWFLSGLFFTWAREADAPAAAPSVLEEDRDGGGR